MTILQSMTDTTLDRSELMMNAVSKTASVTGHIEVENHGSVLVAHIHGGPHAVFDASMAKQLKELVDRADRDPNIRAVIFTGAHPERFLSHADVKWLKQGGLGFPPINTTIAGLVARMARGINRLPVVRSLLSLTRFKTLLQLDSFHATMLKMNRSGVIFIAAINGNALAVGAEFALACDLRIMADGDYVMGLSEVLLALTPGGGGSQRLTRLIGRQRALTNILEGAAFSPAQALAMGAIDEVVPKETLLARAMERAEYLALRSKKSHGAIKRSVYFGGSLSLEDGLITERAEFLVLDQSKEAQALMDQYIAATEANGDVPFMDRNVYARALATGHVGD
jgi:enoyl-CoA hydratase/carnithine racemase